MNCKHLSDRFGEVCVNADCPACTDFCPCVNYPGLCRYFVEVGNEQNRTDNLRLSGDFNRGYLRALLDLSETMPPLCDDLLRCRIPLRTKRIREMLGMYLKCREQLREQRGFLRWNVKEKEFEWFDPNSSEKK